MVTRFESHPPTIPLWVVNKEGELVLADADFKSTIGYKWGTFVDGTGTVISDTNHYFGGSRSVKMLTEAVAGSNAELKINLAYPLGAGIYAMEHKWATGDPNPLFASSTIHFGIEPRENASDGFWQGRVRYTVSSDEWQYESGIDVYTSFSPSIIVEQPSLDTALGGSGDKWGWARLVIDTIKKEYVLFEAAALGGITKKDMRGIPLVNRGAATQYNLLFFTLVKTGGVGAEVCRTTDWCITKL